MLELEQKIHDALPTIGRQRRFARLVRPRRDLARLTAEMTCWTGSVEHPTLDRQVVLYEHAIARPRARPGACRHPAIEWIVYDAGLIHVRGYAPPGLNCPVCKDGAFGLSDVLARNMLDRLPDEIQ